MATNSVEIIDETKNTNLHLLALNGDHQELAKFKSGTKVDVQNSYGLTPLMFAARYGHLEALKILLKLRADATKTNKYGGSVFLMAVASGNLDVINILLQHLLSGGVSRQAIETRFSPISMSILFSHEHVFKFLIGSKFNTKSISLYTGLTPLMFAVLNEKPVFTKHLRLLGADPRVKNANNETCHDLEKRLNGPGPGQQEPDQQRPPTATGRQEKLHIKIPQHKQPMQQVQQPRVQPPVLIVSSVSQPQYYNQMPFARKSSDAITPEVMTPTISPLGYYPQVFFPTDFTPSQFASPTLFIPYHQHHAFRQDYVVSPVYNIPSPFTNMHNVNITEDVFFA